MKYYRVCPEARRAAPGHPPPPRPTRSGDKMKFPRHVLAAVALLAVATASNAAEPLKAEVIHWWTSGGESAAAKTLAEAYKAQGGLWIDTAVALGEQARSVAINRIAGGNPPTAAQFTPPRRSGDIVDQVYLNRGDDVARRDGGEKSRPGGEPVPLAVHE